MSSNPCVHTLYNVYKAIMRWLTGRGEVERLLNSGEYTAKMGKDFEAYVLRSRLLRPPDVHALHTPSSALYRLPAFDILQREPLNTNSIAQICAIIIRVKHFKAESPDFAARVYPNLEACVRRLGRKICLQTVLNHTTTTPFNKQVAAHEDTLMQIWTILKPDTPLTGRISKQWEDIGFQGLSPHQTLEEWAC